MALVALVAGMLAWPASAQADTLVSVTGDNGVAQPLSGQTMRNMAPQVAFTPDPGQSVRASITGRGPSDTLAFPFRVDLRAVRGDLGADVAAVG